MPRFNVWLPLLLNYEFLKKILCVVGTRPEAIKMAPVILALRKCSDIHCRVLAPVQHRNLLDQVLRIFEIEPDIDLMHPNQALTTLTARLLLALNDVLEAEKPEVVLAQGPELIPIGVLKKREKLEVNGLKIKGRTYDVPGHRI